MNIFNLFLVSSNSSDAYKGYEKKRGGGERVLEFPGHSQHILKKTGKGEREREREGEGDQIVCGVIFQEQIL
jgi:hypothetical protein